MDIAEIQKRKRELEAEIGRKLQQFMDETGVSVERVDVQTVRGHGKRQPEVYSVVIEAKI